MRDPYTSLSKTRRERFEREDKEAMECSECGNAFFLELKANRFKKDQTGIVGQVLPRLDNVDYPVYMCVKCRKIIVPATDGSNVGRRAQLHNRLCDTIEGTQKELEPTFQGLASNYEAVNAQETD